MYPILFSSGEFHLWSYEFFTALSCLIGFVLGWKTGKQVGYSNKENIIGFCGILITAYLGGCVNSWFFKWLNPAKETDLNSLLASGFGSFGAFMGALAFSASYAHFCKRSSLGSLDLLSGILPLVESIFRIGCLLAGCCYGKETSGFGGLYLPNIYDEWANRFPTPIIYILFNFSLFLWLRSKWIKKQEPGRVTVLYLGAYGTGRFLIDFLRADEPMVGILSYHQIAAVATILIAICLAQFIRKGQKYNKSNIHVGRDNI